HGRHRRERHAAALRRLVELLDRLLAAPLLEEDLERVEVGAAREPVLEQLHRRPLRIPHDLDEVSPLMLFDAAQEDPAVLALHEAEGLDRLGPQARRDQAAVWPEAEGELEDGGQRLLHRDLDVLPLAGCRAREECGERGDGGVQTGLESGLLSEGPQWW